MPIIENKLEVEIQETLVNSSTIVGFSKDPNVRARNQFLVEAISSMPTRNIKLGPGSFEISRTSINKPDLESALADYNSGKLVSFILNIQYGSKSGQCGTVRVYLKKTEKNIKGHGKVARGGLEITDYCGDNFNKNWNGLVYIDGDTELMRILRHSEPPNHSKFEVGT